jgi:hypothetical protein
MTNPWAHGRINNESSYDLILVTRRLLAPTNIVGTRSLRLKSRQKPR